MLKSSVRTSETFVMKVEEWTQVVDINRHYSIAIRIRIRQKGHFVKGGGTLCRKERKTYV